MDNARKTSISWVENGEITIRDRKIEDLIGNVGWGEMVYLMLMGRMPKPEHAKMLEAILVSVVDHGVRPPSTIAAVTSASTGASLNAAVASGILSINKYHGGAIEDAMAAISDSVTIASEKTCEANDAASTIVERCKIQGKRISGFGHRFHGTDPRTIRLFELAAELGVAGKFVEHANAISSELTSSLGREMPINADGAIAALLCELEFTPAAANGIFMIARVPGLVAHVIEEQARNKPMMTVDVDNYEYVPESTD